VAALALTAAPAAAQDFSWRGQLAAGQTLEIKGINGDIRAVASPSGDAVVTAVKTSQRGDAGAVRIVAVPHAGGVTICALYPDVAGAEPNQCGPGGASRSRNQNNDTSVAFAVQVPAGVTFIARTVNGGINADSLTGDAEAHTVNGSIHLTTTGSGVANTVNGSVNVSLGRADWPNGAKFSTVNGGITLHLPAYVSAELRASAQNGDIESDFPIAMTGTMSRRRVEGTIGNGGPQLTVSTVNGSVRLLRGQ
jgi:hypothetical protein